MLLVISNLVFAVSVFACSGGGADKAAHHRVKTEAVERLVSSAKAEPNNCVNPGGTCNGTVPCCDPNTNFCVRNTCQPVPQN